MGDLKCLPGLNLTVRLFLSEPRGSPCQALLLLVAHLQAWTCESFPFPDWQPLVAEYFPQTPEQTARGNPCPALPAGSCASPRESPVKSPRTSSHKQGPDG